MAMMEDGKRKRVQAAFLAAGGLSRATWPWNASAVESVVSQATQALEDLSEHFGLAGITSPPPPAESQLAGPFEFRRKAVRAIIDLTGVNKPMVMRVPTTEQDARQAAADLQWALWALHNASATGP